MFISLLIKIHTSTTLETEVLAILLQIMFKYFGWKKVRPLKYSKVCRSIVKPGDFQKQLLMQSETKHVLQILESQNICRKGIPFIGTTLSTHPEKSTQIQKCKNTIFPAFTQSGSPTYFGQSGNLTRFYPIQTTIYMFLFLVFRPHNSN